MAQEREEFSMLRALARSGSSNKKKDDEDKAPGPIMIEIRDLAERCEHKLRCLDEERAALRAALDMLLERERELLEEERVLRAAERQFKFY
jgi:hypothetical protein